MVRRLMRGTIVLAAVLAAGSFLPGDWNQACAVGRQRTAPDLFYNFYVPPVGYGGVGAEMYVCPLPTPPLVGHTYYTYQPLMPHEFLYPHARVYWHYQPSGRPTRTLVIWK